MSNFAIISENIVSNIIFADSLEDAELVLGVSSCIEYTDDNPASIGWTYNADTGKFSAPVTKVIDVFESKVIEASPVIEELPVIETLPAE